MRTNLLVVGGAAALLLAGVAGAVVTGIGPAPGSDSGTDIEAFPTETDSTSSGGDDSPSESTATASTSPFALSIDSIEDCGQTCRDVTSTLTNRQDTAATDVTVYTRLYAGNGTDGDVVWEGTESVGTLDAGESDTATKRVELSYGEAYTIEQNDGWVTVQTTVETGERTVTFTEQRQVA